MKINCKNNKFQIIFFFGLNLLAFIFFIQSCKVGDNYIRTAPVLPENYNYNFPSDTNIVNTPWWELFGDTVLVSLIREGLEKNKDLKKAVARMNETMAAMGIVRADLYPQVAYGVGGSSTAATGNSGLSHDYSGAVNASYTIDIWGRVKRLEEAALQEYLASEEAYRGLNIMLVSQIATAYFTLRDLDNRLYISEKTAESWRSNLQIVEARFKGGFVSEVDLNMANIQLYDALTAIQTFTRLKIQLENALSALLGNTPQTIRRGLALQNQILPLDIPVGFPSELLDRRPDVLQTERSLNAQTERVGAAEALRYPAFTLSADLGMTFINPVTGFASLGGQVLGPLFNMNANKRRVEVEKARTEQLLSQYELVIINAVREVEDAMIAVKTYKIEFELRNEQMKASINAVDLSWVRYEGGLTSYLEVLDLQRSAFNSQLKASESLQFQLVSIVQLYQALGGGWN
jgi:multidrug efflux system outer membrane protein